MTTSQRSAIGKRSPSTEAGVRYYIEAGGFRWFFDLENAQSGRLRLALS